MSGDGWSLGDTHDLIPIVCILKVLKRMLEAMAEGDLQGHSRIVDSGTVSKSASESSS